MLFCEDIDNCDNGGDDNDGGGGSSSSGGHGSKPTRYRGKGKEGNTQQSTPHTRIMSLMTMPSAMRVCARVQ